MPLGGKCGHLELYLRDLEQGGYAPATVSRRLSTVAGLFKYAVLDELVATNRTLAVTRPHAGGEPAPHGAAPAGVRRRPHGRPPAQRDSARSVRAARHARATGQRGLRRPGHRSAVRRGLRGPARARQGRQASDHPLPIPVLLRSGTPPPADRPGRSCSPPPVSPLPAALPAGSCGTSSGSRRPPRRPSRTPCGARSAPPGRSAVCRSATCSTRCGIRRPPRHPLRHGPHQPGPARRPQRRAYLAGMAVG